MTIHAKDLEHRPGEDPFVVVRGGFYRRWLTMFDDLEELISIVNQLEETTEDKWVPVWRAAGRKHEEEGDRLDKSGYNSRCKNRIFTCKNILCDRSVSWRDLTSKSGDKHGLRAGLP